MAFDAEQKALEAKRKVLELKKKFKIQECYVALEPLQLDEQPKGEPEEDVGQRDIDNVSSNANAAKKMVDFCAELKEKSK